MLNVSEYLKNILENNLLSNSQIDLNLVNSAQEMRTSYREIIPTAGIPDPVERVEDTVISVNTSNKVPVRIYWPLNTDQKTNLPMILFIHGGGFVSGDLDTHDVLVRAIANGVQAVVVSVDYRLAPEFPFPAPLEDVYVSLQWMIENADMLGGDIGRVAVVGDSAGGNLAAALTLLARDIGEIRISVQWLIYPEVSNKMDTDSWKTYGETQFPTKTLNTMFLSAYTSRVNDPYISYVAPLWGNHKNLPPALLQVGEFDPLKDETIQYAEALSQNNVDSEVIVYPEQVHGFIQFYKDKTNHSRGEEALQVGLSFLNRYLNP